jgi:hypothetical protein
MENVESSECRSIPGHGVLTNPSATFSVNHDGNRPRPHHQILAIALVAGVAAGLLSFTGGEFAYGAFRPRLFKVDGPGMVSMQPSVESQHAADLKNAALAFAVLGCVTALAMGIAGGVAGRSFGRGTMVGLGAQAGGSLVGSLAALVLLPLVSHRFGEGTNDVVWRLVIHTAILSAIGAVGGLAFAIGMGCRRSLVRAVTATSVAAFLAAALIRLFDVCFSAHSAQVDLVARSSILRFVAMFVPSLLIAVGAATAIVGSVRLQQSPGSDC